MKNAGITAVAEIAPLSLVYVTIQSNRLSVNSLPLNANVRKVSSVINFNSIPNVDTLKQGSVLNTKNHVLL